MKTRAAALYIGLLFAAGPATALAGGGGRVLPGDAQPQGFSLGRMVAAWAQWFTSFDNQYIPDTPLQTLQANGGEAHYTFSDGGLTVTGTQTGTVYEEPEVWFMQFFANDSPPLLLGWPTDACGAEDFAFNPAYTGAHDMEVIIDGKSTPLGADSVVGPVLTPPLLDGGGNHIVAIGTFFLDGLKPGHHTVRVRTNANGAAVVALGLAFFNTDWLYEIDVIKGKAPGDKRKDFPKADKDIAQTQKQAIKECR